MPSEQDFKSYLERKRAEAIDKAETVTEPARATALHVDHVTHDPEWNLYLQKLQVHVDRAKAARDDLREKIPMAMPAEIREQAVFAYWRWMGFLEGIELAINLPKALLEDTKHVPSA